ncbi:replication-associated recombination protein A, partial [Candidatus Parcubacteria bacterium]|nr:replication-associated recombination protein A [Candidatus Parcubacteria bacterium]
HFVEYSAVSTGVRDVRKVVSQARERLLAYGQKTILFIDEIHRFNKAQQDSFLPHVENGTIVLIGATTENPSFEVISPLLSRCKVLVLNPLDPATIEKLVNRTLTDSENGLGNLKITLDPEAREALVQYSNGDARIALNTLETAANLKKSSQVSSVTLAVADIKQALQTNLRYDRAGEEHYNTISAFIKSMRGSDPDAALYYLARMVEAGEDPLFVARRMVVLASEDIGNADPQALPLAVATFQACERIGLPECQINLAHCVTYLAAAPKSNASYHGLLQAKKDVAQTLNEPIPLHLRNAPTQLMKDLGYGKNYQYDHNFENHHAGQSFLPEKLRGRRYYSPTEIGEEKKLKERLEKLRGSRTTNSNSQ